METPNDIIHQHILVAYIGQITQPMYALRVKLALSAQFDLTVAIATIYWPTLAGFERYLSVFATLGAFHREHLPLGPVAAVATSITLGLPCLAAWETALRLISIAFRGE